LSVTEGGAGRQGRSGAAPTTRPGVAPATAACTPR
jgi:hypothetical protein